MADEAVCIGEAPSSESYLNVPNLLAAAVSRGAQAVHPVSRASTQAHMRVHSDLQMHTHKGSGFRGGATGIAHPRGAAIIQDSRSGSRDATICVRCGGVNALFMSRSSAVAMSGTSTVTGLI
jgi:hypothetical protein